GGGGAREDPVDRPDDVDERGQVVHASANGARELCEDARDLGILLALTLHEVVVGIDDAIRLDEQRLATLRAVVDDAAHARTRFCADRHDVTTVAHGDVALPEDAIGVLAFPEPFEILNDAPPTIENLATNLREPPTCPIGDGTVGVEAPAEHVVELR